MKTLGTRRVLSLLLSAAVLFGGLMPPAVQHAHAEGERPHAHEPVAAAAPSEHSHSHSHPHSHSTGPVAEPHPAAAECIQCRTWHRHVVLFGFELCLPMHGDQQHPASSGTAGDDQAVTLIRLIDTVTLAASPQMAKSVLIGLPDLPAVSAVPLPVADSWDGRDTGSSIPLCDSARRERSGVQLI